MPGPKMREIKIKSYAKINLALDVIGLRDDGYHMLETVMQKIGLSDEISIKWQESTEDDFGIVLRAGKPYLPTDERILHTGQHSLWPKRQMSAAGSKYGL